MKHGQTPSQTAGPYFAYGLTPQQYGYQGKGPADTNLRVDGIKGEPIRIEGRVFDGEGVAIDDAMLEIWQADPDGIYPGGPGKHGDNTAFAGFGRVGTGADPDNRYFFDTIKPGRVDGHQAPHLNLIVFMRGMLTHAFTRIYFSDESDANKTDPALALVPADRRETLIAQRDDSSGVVVYRLDLHMQGKQETVFFEI